MAKQQAAARRPPRPARDKQQESESGPAEKGPDTGDATYEKELSEYLQERIKPGLNRGAIPLLARSLAKEIVRRNQEHAASEEESNVDDEPRTEADDEFDDEPRTRADDEVEDEADEDFEDEAADDEPEDEAEDEAADDEPEDEAEDDAEDEPEDDDEDDDEPESDVAAFEEEMHQLQADLGDEWILRFSVQGDEAWLTAEKEDGSQHLEAPTADLIREAVDLLEDGGGSD